MAGVIRNWNRMFAIHSVWRTDRHLAMWAEQGIGGVDSRHPWHPFACSAQRVTDLLSGTGVSVEWLVETGGRNGLTELLLPTRSGKPCPSPELTGEGHPTRLGADRGCADLVAWRVPSVLFAPAEAVQLLGALFQPQHPFLSTELAGLGQFEVPYGASLRWLIMAHDLAWRLVKEGLVLPTLNIKEGSQPYARWQPAPDSLRLRESRVLCASMPPICRAESPGRNSEQLTGELLTTFVDCEARAALEGLPTPWGLSPAKATAENWFKALLSPTGRLEHSSPAEAEALRDQLVAWRCSEVPVHNELRLCFRVVEPTGAVAGTDDAWRIELLAQSADESSLLVSAGELWTEGPSLRALRRKMTEPHDLFMTALRQASGIWPPLSQALYTPYPSHIDLDRAETLHFLRHVAPSLAAAGYGVFLPSWWNRPTRIGLALTVRDLQVGIVKSAAVLRKESIAAFQWQLSVGDIILNDEELADLAAAKQPLVRIHGQWIEVDLRQIAAAAAFLARSGQGSMSVDRIARIALSADATFAGLPVTAVTAKGELGDLLAGNHKLPSVTLPREFGTQLRSYQRRGVSWLAHLSKLGLGAVLADDMGLGKGVQVLALLASEHPSSSGPTLLICPMSLVGNWQREATRFTPMLRLYVHHGADRQRGDDLKDVVANANLVITTYGLAQRESVALRDIHWRRIIADEAQHVKNLGALRSKALRALSAEHRIALTGTPVENRLSELHAILDFTNPGLFGSVERFKELYSHPIERPGGSMQATRDLRRRTRPLILRRLKTDSDIISDLPLKKEMTVLCNLTTEQAGLYRAVVSDMLAGAHSSTGMHRKGLILSGLSKLKQICNHPAQLLKENDVGARLGERSGKLARLEEILEECVGRGEKVLCFTQFAALGSLMRVNLGDLLEAEVQFLHGATPRRAREEMITWFQESAGSAVLLLTLKAGGTGLNLTAASHVIHVDRWWNPAVEDQATDRAFRIGQTQDVQVRKLVCIGTVEERIQDMIETKRALARAVVESGENWLSDLSTDALRELIKLSPEAESE